jgi:murein DD-endopeptidase MepM/ murein hydrolase activator NlpD
VKKALLKTPINGARITSGFGMRMHPLLGYSKMHKGIDFGAAIGTPIYAAGDGVIEEAGRKGGYGNYVKLKHNDHYATAYGHASRIARGIHPGVHVKQGQVIAYVGSTGFSTGPHLHYEILVNGAQVNPSGVKFRTGQTLAGHEMAEFKKQQKQVQVALNTLPRTRQVASLER